MNIGFFDSGIGGLTILRAVKELMPEYDTYYFGDVKNAPYGSKSREEICRLLADGIRYLFEQDSQIVIVACNSASVHALRYVQETVVPNYPGRRVLGVVIPTVEELVRRGYERVLIFSTVITATSGAYEREFRKLNPSVSITMHACPNWATMIESGRVDAEEMRKEIRSEVDLAFANGARYDAVLLGCTHYPYIKSIIEDALPYAIPVFDQGPMVARALLNYLARHPEIDGVLSRNSMDIRK